MSRTTLDIIGLAGEFSTLYIIIIVLFFKSGNFQGFDYNFNALSSDPEKNELMKAFSTIFKSGQKLSANVIPILRSTHPALRFIVRISVVTSSFYQTNFYINWIYRDSRHQTTSQVARPKLYWIISEWDFSGKVRVISYHAVKTFFRYWFKPTPWKRKRIRWRMKM